jgi:hypothetical protein
MASTASIGVASPVGFTAGLETRSSDEEIEALSPEQEIELRLARLQSREGNVLRLREHSGHVWTWDLGIRLQDGDESAFDEPPKDDRGIFWGFTCKWEVEDPAEALVLFLAEKIQLTATTAELYQVLDDVLTRLKREGCLVLGKQFTPTEAAYWPLLRVWPPGSVPSTESRKLPVLPDLFQDRLASAPTYQIVPGILQAIQEGQVARITAWTDSDGQTAPRRRVYTDTAGNGAYLSVRGADESLHPPRSMLPVLWAKLREFDDLTSDVLLYCLCCWATRASGPSEPVWVGVDKILDERGIRRKRLTGARGGQSEPGNWQHGHRREERLEVARAIGRLRNAWIEVLDIQVGRADKRGRRRVIRNESPLLVTRDRWTARDFDGTEVPIAAEVLPGGWAREFWETVGRQTGLLAQHALSYDPYRRKPEKRLAKYLAFHVRINANHRLEVLKRQVGTLLEAIGPDAIKDAKVDRVRKRLEEALDTLVEDQVIAGWLYDRQTVLPARGWFAEWKIWTIAIRPAEAVARHYAEQLRGESPAVSTAGD